MDPTERARQLRQQQTDAEERLWSKLRNNQTGYKFKRQYPFNDYILDFYCQERKLAIEVDGGQHTEEKDQKRTDFLSFNNIQVLRFWNNEVLQNTEGVMTRILQVLTDPSPQPSPKGEGVKRICVGQIATSHGVRGLVKVHCFADDPDVLQTCGPLYTSETGNKTLTLTLKNATNTHWLASVEGIADKTAADKLRGTELYLDRDALPELDAGYYHADLMGLSVMNDDGAPIGTVSAIDNFGASDLIEVKPEVGQAFYVPLTDDYATIDIENSRVVIRNYKEFQNLSVTPAQAGVHDQELHPDMDSRFRGNDQELEK